MRSTSPGTTGFAWYLYSKKLEKLGFGMLPDGCIFHGEFDPEETYNVSNDIQMKQDLPR